MLTIVNKKHGEHVIYRSGKSEAHCSCL